MLDIVFDIDFFNIALACPELNAMYETGLILAASRHHYAALPNERNYKS
jgi:hypothetical protein